MKSIALSLTLLAALAGAQTTVTENFYATISLKELKKPHPSSSAALSASTGGFVSSSAAGQPSSSGAVISSASPSQASSSGSSNIPVFPTGQSAASGSSSAPVFPTGQSAASGSSSVPVSPTGQSAASGSSSVPVSPTGQSAASGSSSAPVFPTGQSAASGSSSVPVSPTGQSAASGRSSVPVSPTGQPASSGSGMTSYNTASQIPSSGIIPSSQSGKVSSNTATVGPQSSATGQFSAPSVSSSFKYSNSSSNTFNGFVPAGMTIPASQESVTAQKASLVTAAFSSKASSTSSVDAAASSSAATSSSSSVSASTTLDSATASIILNEHNVLRNRHENTPPLTWSDDLSAWAYNYANTLKNTDNDPCSGQLLHSTTRGNQGENIAFGTYSNSAALVDYWYDEINDYDYNNVTGVTHNGQDVGHFTQLVWASSTQVGCAAIECPANDGLYLLCEYTPAGNVYMVGVSDTYVEFKSNVLPLKT